MPVTVGTLRGLVDYRVEQALQELAGAVNALEGMRTADTEHTARLGHAEAVAVQRLAAVEQQVILLQGLVQPGGAPAGGLTPTGVVPGTYGTAAQVGQFTVDANGRLTAAADVAISLPPAPDYVVASDGGTPTPAPMDDGFGNFIYIPYTP